MTFSLSVQNLQLSDISVNYLTRKIRKLQQQQKLGKFYLFEHWIDTLRQMFNAFCQLSVGKLVSFIKIRLLYTLLLTTCQLLSCHCNVFVLTSFCFQFFKIFVGFPKISVPKWKKSCERRWLFALFNNKNRQIGIPPSWICL